MKINFDIMFDYKEELEALPKCLPTIIITDVVDIEKYYDNLEKNHVFDEVYQQIYERRNKLKKNYSFEQEYEELAQWCHENPKYMKFII